MSNRLVDHNLLTVTGYTDRLSARPGESVNVHASSVHKSGSLSLVQLSHDGKSFTKHVISAPVPIQLEHREVILGSYGVVEHVEFPVAPLALGTWVWVSLLPTSGSNDASVFETDGLKLTLDSAGYLAFKVNDSTVKSTSRLQLRRWYHVTAGIGADDRAYLALRAQRPEFGEPKVERTVGDDPAGWKAHSGALVIGRGLDGKLEDVRVGRSEDDNTSGDVVRLDFAKGISTWMLHDNKGEEVGRVFNLPTRGVRGHSWDGTEHAWRYAPNHYAAIHFHSDDQGDQQWPVSATVKLKEDLPSGVYAAELSAGSDVDHIPFIVRRRHGRPAPLLVLLPTLTYLAYALEHATDEAVEKFGWKVTVRELCAEFARANGYHSLYDSHADGSPVVLASLHRPLLSVRPDYRYRFSRCEHGLSADLHLIGWLTRQGFAFDVAIDHDLDSEGLNLLAPYRGVITGNHPEYYSGRMLDALDSYLSEGGSLAYLGGNGFCWTTTLDPNDPSVAELRRGQHGMGWEGQVGEEHFQLSGLPGGLWNECGRMQGAMVGVTWSCTGMEQGMPYRRTPASFDPRAVHLFAGIGTDELIGERGAFLGAAASWEVDAANPLPGTPAHALVVATAAMPKGYEGHPLPLLTPAGKEDDRGLRRSDITYFEARGGGAVFSTGSMGWIGALSDNNDDNAASRLTANALRSFVETRP